MKAWHALHAGDQVKMVGHSSGYPSANCNTTQPWCEAGLRPQVQPTPDMILPADSAARKQMPITTGVLDYFPLAIAAVARVSKKGNDKHNPGQPLQWNRPKSTDHRDCIARHLIDFDALDPDSGEVHAASLAWRALALLELLEEKRLNLGPSRAST